MGIIWLGPSFRGMLMAVLRSQRKTQEPRDRARVGVEDAGSHFTIRRVKDSGEKGDNARGVGAPKVANVGSWHERAVFTPAQEVCLLTCCGRHALAGEFFCP